MYHQVKKSALIALLLFNFNQAGAEVPKLDPLEHSVDLEQLRSKSLEGVKRADQGFCSPEFYDAGVALQDLIFYKTTDKYKAGNAREVWGRNQGLQNYFRDTMFDYPEMVDDKAAFIDRLRELDEHYPVTKFGDNGASLDSTSPYNAYAEALKVTKGNVFRAVTLVGSIGHDDVGNFRWESNLFAPNSIGVSLPDDVIKRFKESGERCVVVYGPDQRACTGHGSNLGYHVNFGFYLGCYFAKKGFGKAAASKLFADAAVAVFNDPYLEKELAEQTKTGKLLNRQYQFNVCSDLPKLLGYFYKKTTMANWMTPDARALYEKGYNRPFLDRDGKNPVSRPAGWSDEKWKKAVANLDYRLAHLEYGSQQAAAGAKRGAEVCSEYAANIKPGGLSTEAEMLYKLGNLSPEKTTNELVRVPESLKVAPEKLSAAWTELSAALRAIRPRLDYDALPKGTDDQNKKIQHLVAMLADREMHTPLFGTGEPQSFHAADQDERLAKMDKTVEGLNASEIFDYLQKKTALTPLTAQTEPDAIRHGKMLDWAVRKFPELKMTALNYLNDDKSDFLTRVIFEALQDSAPKQLREIARRKLPDAPEPLLSKLIRTLSTGQPTDAEPLFVAIRRIRDIAPNNVLKVAPSLLKTVAYLKDEKNLATKNFASKFHEMSSSDQDKLLRLLIDENPTETDVVKLALPLIKSDDPTRIKLSLMVLQENPSEAKNFTDDLNRIEHGTDRQLAYAARELLLEIRKNK